MADTKSIELDEALKEIALADKDIKWNFAKDKYQNDKVSEQREFEENTRKSVPTTCIQSTDFLITKAKSLNKTLKNVAQKQTLYDVHEDYLWQILECVTQMEMAVRDSLLDSKINETVEKNSRYCDVSGISVGQNLDSILCVTLPPLMGRRYKGSYAIYRRLTTILKNYFDTHERPQLYGQKLLLIYKKYTPFRGITVNADNDNWEMKRVTNAISEQLRYSDNSEHFSFMYTTVKSEANCVEALLIPLDKLPKYQEYLSSPTPIQNLPTEKNLVDFQHEKNSNGKKSTL